MKDKKRYFIIFWNYIGYPESNYTIKKPIISILKQFDNVFVLENDLPNVVMLESERHEFNENSLPIKLMELFTIENRRYAGINGHLELYVKEVRDGFSSVFPIIKESM